MPHQNFNRRLKNLRHQIPSDSGSAVLEFVGFGLLLQIPLLIIAMSLAEVQQEQFAAEAIARHSLRSFVLAGTPPSETAAEVVTDFRLKAAPILQLSCRPIGDCEASGAIITLKVQLGRAQAQSIMTSP